MGVERQKRFYASYDSIPMTMEYDFKTEAAFSYKNLSKAAISSTWHNLLVIYGRYILLAKGIRAQLRFSSLNI